MAITYYYPEGPLGPICDIFIDDADDGLREVEPDDGDGRAPTYGPLDFGGVENVIGEPAPFLTSRRCRVRTLADGTEEYYDCIDDLTLPISPPPDFPLIEPQYDWPGVSTKWGIDDIFEPIEIGPEVCSPFDPDINITPVKFFKADGTFVLKTQVEKSSPVTFPVTDGSPSTIITRQILAEFIDEGLYAYFLADGTGIQVDGTGTGTITLEFDWDDSPNTSGQSVGSMTIGGQTFDQGNNNSGNQTRSFQVTGGEAYYWTFSGQSSTAGFIVDDGGQSISFDDDAGNGFDVNSTLRISNLNTDGGALILRVTDQSTDGVTWTGTAQVGLRLEWDDNPNTSGLAVGSVTVASQTLTQQGEKGNQEVLLDVSPGTDYPLVIASSGGGGGGTNTYPITIAALGDKGRGPQAAVKSVSNDTIKFTDATFQMDTDSELKIKSTSSGVSAEFDGSDENDLELIVTGNGTVTLEFEWDDDTNTNGKSVGELYIDGQTIDQSGDEGEEEITITVGSGGDGGQSSTAGYRLKGTQIIEWDDDAGNGFDVNATLSITGYNPAESEPGPGAWNDDADLYAVWVNPEVCTLPTLQQTVTYLIDIPATDTYTITGGADDEFQVYLNDSTTPIIGGPAGIFEPAHEIHHTGKYTPPYSTQTTLTKGVLKMVVTCTNGSTENDVATGLPTGSAFQWFYNPGGWYIKICRGTKCIESTSIDWVHSGPNGEGQWGDFMDKYAVYPSNSDVLLNIDHSATYDVLIPAAGDYILEWGMDDVGTISLDGTQIVSSGYEPNSQTYTISNLSAGPHTIGVTIRNNGPKGDWIANPGGIAWTLTPADSQSTVSWTISGQNSDAGYRIRNNGQRIQWDDDATNDFDVNATMDIGKVTQLMGSNVSVSFRDDGTGLDVTGSGEAEVRLDFDWDDSPNISGLAVSSLTIAGQTFTQTTSNENETYPIGIAALGDKGRGPTAAVKSVSNDTIKFTDSTDQMDTDAEFKIKSTSPGVSANFEGSNDSNLELVATGQGTVTLELEWDDDRNRNGKSVGELYIDGQTIDQSGDEGDETITIDVNGGDQNSQSKTITVKAGDVVASSLDLKAQTTEGNLIWHTRKATGYEYVEIT